MGPKSSCGRGTTYIAALMGDTFSFEGAKTDTGRSEPAANSPPTAE
jgi:hypothetical protein